MINEDRDWREVAQAMVRALAEAYGWQDSANYARHGSHDLVPDGTIPQWFVRARQAMYLAEELGLLDELDERPYLPPSLPTEGEA